MLDPVTATVIAVGAVGGSIYSSEKARKEQKKARKAQDRIRQTQSARERLAQVRQARIAQSSILQSGATQGTMDSSATQGAYSAVGSAAAGNIQFINQMDSLQQEVSRRMEKSNMYSAQAGYYGQAANLAMQGSSMLGSPTKSTAPTTPGSMSTTSASGAQASTIAGRGPFDNPLSPSLFG